MCFKRFKCYLKLFISIGFCLNIELYVILSIYTCVNIRSFRGLVFFVFRNKLNVHSVTYLGQLVGGPWLRVANFCRSFFFMKKIIHNTKRNTSSNLMREKGHSLLQLSYSSSKQNKKHDNIFIYNLLTYMISKNLILGEKRFCRNSR